MVNGKEEWAIEAEFKGKAEARHIGGETSEIFEIQMANSKVF